MLWVGGDVTETSCAAFSGATSAIQYWNWTNYEVNKIRSPLIDVCQNDSCETTFPEGEWLFVAASADVGLGAQYALKYRLNPGGAPKINFKSRTSTNGFLYTLDKPTTYAILGGDADYGACNCSMQFVRFYLDYTQNTLLQMLDLAFLSSDAPKGTFHSFRNHLLTTFN